MWFIWRMVHSRLMDRVFLILFQIQEQKQLRFGSSPLWKKGRQGSPPSRCDIFFWWVELTEPESISASKPSIETDASKRQQVEEVLEELMKDRFPETFPSGLPPHREVDHEIDLEPGQTPPSRPTYRLSQPGMQELEKQISNLLEHGYIQPSRSPYGAPVLFVQKKDGCFRLVCDWRQLNKITIKNKACLPNPEDLFDVVQLQGSRFLPKLDLASGFHQVRIRECDIAKTAINTPIGHFEFNVLGFFLINVPATFSMMMNNILRPFLWKSVVVFLDDILIYSRTWEEHVRHVREVLQTFRTNKMFCKPAKCVFGAETVKFLG